MIEQVIYGAAGGLLMAGAGYFKSVEKKEEFDSTKFCTTVVLGAFVGGISGVTGWTPDFVMAMPVYAAITVFVENLFKGVIRRITP